jgi:hypothetical protein
MGFRIPPVPPDLLGPAEPCESPWPARAAIALALSPILAAALVWVWMSGRPP